MRELILRLYWWFVRRIYGVRLTGGIEFVYIHADADKSAAAIQRTVEEALTLITASGSEHEQLVHAHLRFIAVMRAPSVYVVRSVGAYVSPFRGHEATSSQYLACQLIWAAKYLQLAEEASGTGRDIDKSTLWQAAYDAQLRFCELLPESESWLEYLKSNQPSAHPSVSG